MKRLVCQPMIFLIFILKAIYYLCRSGWGRRFFLWPLLHGQPETWCSEGIDHTGFDGNLLVFFAPFASFVF